MQKPTVYTTTIIVTIHSDLCSKVLFWRCLCLFSLFVYEISWEPLNGFAPNSHGRRVLSVAWNLEEFECQGQSSKVKVTRNKNALCTPITTRHRRNGPFCCMMLFCSERVCSRMDHSITTGGWLEYTESVGEVWSTLRPVCGLCLVKHL